MQLKDQAAIVTGGASGLGAATARRLAAQGARVAVCDLNAKLAESVAAEIGGIAVVCDVADAGSAEAAIVTASKAHGPARVLVNCAGIGVAKRVIGRDGPMPLADFDRVGRGLRRSDRTVGLFGLQRRHRRDDAADRARAGAVRHSRAHHRAGIVPDAAVGQFAAGGAGQPRRVDTVSAPARARRRVRLAGTAHDRQSIPERRGGAARCLASHGAALRYCMFVNRRDVQIQWGDCDPANIVYYPRYFEMFDDSTSILFEAAGFSKQDIIKKYGLVGIRMVDTRAKFYIASPLGDWITIESRIESFKRSSFEVTHKVFKGEALAIEAFETRVLVGRHPDDPSKLKSAAVPEEIVAKFMRG